jgi:hypothetical protein
MNNEESMGNVSVSDNFCDYGHIDVDTYERLWELSRQRKDKYFTGKYFHDRYYNMERT